MAASALMLQFLPPMEKKHKFMIWSMFAQSMGLILFVVPTFPFLINKFDASQFVIIYCVIALIRGLAFGFTNVPMQVVYQTLTPDEYRGRVFALQGTFFQAAKPVGVMLVGILIDIYPPYMITTISGILMAVACMIMFTVKDIKDI
jgi:predicted MFS family arabinose efflux permease